MLYGCCTTLDNYGLLVRYGCDTITLAGKDVAAMGEKTFRQAAERLAAGPLALRSLNAFCPPQVKLAGEGYRREALAAYAEPLLDRAARLGAAYVGIGCPGSRNVERGFCAQRAAGQLEEALALLCGIGRRCGVDILLEAVCDIECNLITTTDEAVDWVERLGLPNLHLVYDIYHAHMMGESPGCIARAAPHIRAVHVARDEGRGQRHYLRPEDSDMAGSYLRALRGCGYGGEISLEAFCGDPAAGLAASLELLRRT